MHHMCGLITGQLELAGLIAEQLMEVCSRQQLRKAGFSVEQLMEAGFATEQLKLADFTAEQFMEVGRSVEELKLGAGSTAEQLKEVGATTGSSKTIICGGGLRLVLPGVQVAVRALIGGGWRWLVLPCMPMLRSQGLSRGSLA